jgi:hypothetical protein
LTPTSGNPPSGGEEGPEPQTRNPCRRSSKDAIHTSFNHRGTIAESRVCCDHRQNPPSGYRNAGLRIVSCSACAFPCGIMSCVELMTTRLRLRDFELGHYQAVHAFATDLAV